SRSRRWVTRVPASGGSRRTSFVSIPEENLAEAATRSGSREKMSSSETKTRMCHWKRFFKSLLTAGSRPGGGDGKRETHVHINGLALLAVAIFGSSAAAEEKFQKLTAGQIRTKLAGMELTDNVHWRDLYQRNGTVMSTSMGRKRTGKWRVEKDQLCIEFEKEPMPTCYDVWISGNDVELRREGLLPLQGTLELSSGRN